MKTNYSFKSLFTLFLFISTFLYSQKYLVNTDKLNVRENADKNSTVLFQLDKDTEVNAIEVDGEWIKINSSDKIGFVNRKFLKENLKIEISEKGFKYGFNKVFYKIMIGSFFIIGIFTLMSRNKKDARFSTGYRKGQMSNVETILLMIGSVIISLVLSSLVGVCFWIVKLIG